MIRRSVISTLRVGAHYDVEVLMLVGWTRGDGSGTEGYNVHYYFKDGVYLGPDTARIEPIFMWCEEV